MANYATISIDSANKSDTLTLQRLLNSTGKYNLAEDGIFGNKTRAAVKDYQKTNGLTVDGIVGKNTWASLNSGTGKTTAATAKTNTTAPTYQTFQLPENVVEAGKLLDEHLNAKPGDFTWADQGLLDEAKYKWLNREDFQYDLGSDPLYQQYKEQYTRLGQLAMLDTMGQAAALTGGYGNSYAQNVGQQAYQGYLQQLNEVVPELYTMARDQYTAEGEEMYNRLAFLEADRQQAYGEHQDTVSEWYNFLNHLASDYQSKYETAYGQHMDEYNAKYSEWRDHIADQQYQEQMAYQKERDAISDAQWEKQYALSSGGGGGSGGDPIKDGLVDLSSVPDTIADRVSECKSPEEAEKVLSDAEAANIINHDQALALLAQYTAPTDDELPLMERHWSTENDGGVNWFWGVDNNAIVKDNSGNVYRLDDLIDALVAEGIPKATAKDWVKGLQKDLGI